MTVQVIHLLQADDTDASCTSNDRRKSKINNSFTTESNPGFSRYKTLRHDWCLPPVVVTTNTAHCCWSSMVSFVERITFRLAVLTYLCLRGSASEYLSGQLQRVSDSAPRRPRHSSFRRQFELPSAAATSVWNSLPISSSFFSILALFRKSLKTELFKRLYWLID